MSKNIGKVFEDEIKSSIPNEYWFYRFKDGTAGFSGKKNENVRFQAKNICDCQVMTDDTLYLLEMKNTLSSNLPFANIKANQLEGMCNINHRKIKAYFLICFRTKEETYAVEAKRINEFIESTERKSIPVSWCKDNGIRIPMIKKRIRYKYDLEMLFKKSTTAKEKAEYTVKLLERRKEIKERAKKEATSYSIENMHKVQKRIRGGK